MQDTRVLTRQQEPPREVVSFIATIVTAITIFAAPLPVAALAAIAFVAVAAWMPLPALSAIVVSLPFYLLDRHIGRLEFSPTEILIILTTIGTLVRVSPSCLGRAWKDGRVTKTIADLVGDPALAGLVILLFLAAVASLTASVALHESLRSFRTIIFEPIVFYFLVVTQVRERRGAYVLALSLVLAGVAISLVGFWQIVHDQRIITAEDNLWRIRGFYGSPNNLGLFLGRALPMGFALWLWAHRHRLLLLLASVVMAIALVLTFSVGAWIAVAASLVLVTALHGRETLRTALVVAVVGFVVAGVAALRIPRIGSHLNLRTGTSLERLLIWQSALRMLASHPIRGIGLDNFLYYYQHGYRLPAAWREPDQSHPHNLILDFWLSLGLPGLLIAGVLLGRFVELIAARWKASSSVERALYAGAAGAMADTVIHGFVDNSFFLVDLSVLFWLMFAIVAVVYRATEHGIEHGKELA